MKNLEDLRENIDNIDEQIINLFAKRFKIVTEIGKIKKEKNLSPKDNKRWDQVLDKITKLADKNGVRSNFIKNIYDLIHKYALEIEGYRENSYIRNDLIDIKPYPVKIFDKKYVRLDSNENHYLSDKIYFNINNYPHDRTKLIELLTDIYQCENSEIVLTAGSDSGIDLIIRTFCELFESVLICPPTFALYQHHTKVNSRNIIEIPLNNIYQLEVEKIIETVKRESVKVIFIPTPNAPLGHVMNESDLIEIIKKLPQCIIVIDEAYIEFSNAESFVKMINKYKNIIVLRTLSKFYCMAGLRIGSIISNQDNIKYLQATNYVYPISFLSIQTAIDVLANDKINDEMNKNKIIIEKERNRIYNEMQGMKCVVRIFQSEGNFLFIVVNDSKIILEKLLKNKIVVQDMSYQIPNGIRITIGTEAENDNLLQILL